MLIRRTGKHFFNRAPAVDRAPLKKIKNMLSTFSSPRFTVHNPKSKDVLLLAVYYTRLCTGWSTNKATGRFFHRAL